MYDTAVEIDFICYSVYTLLPPWFAGTQLWGEGLISVCACVHMCILQYASGYGSQDSCVCGCLGIQFHYSTARTLLGRALLINGINTGVLIHSLALAGDTDECLPPCQIDTHSLAFEDDEDEG